MSDLIKTFTVNPTPFKIVANNVEVDVYGCLDNSNNWNTDRPYDFYDAYINGICINEGDPFYEMPTEETLLPFVERFCNN
jgi:hypothetical protein